MTKPMAHLPGLDYVDGDAFRAEHGQDVKRPFTDAELEAVRQDVKEQDEYASQIRNLVREAAEEDEREPFIRPVKPEPDRSAYDILDEASATLAADSRAWLGALFWLMTAADYSEDIRAFVLGVAAYSFGKDSDPAGLGTGSVEVSDPELAEYLGCSVKTIGRRRKKYQRESRKYQVVVVDEGPYDKKAQKNKLTRYTFLRGADAADAVIQAKQSPLWEKNKQEALKRAAYSVFNSRLGTPRVGKRRKDRTYSAETVKGLHRKAIKTHLRKLLELEGVSGDPLEAYKELRAELDEIAGLSEDFPQPAEETEINKGGGQIVHPSNGANIRPTIPDFVLPAGISFSDAARTPSIARQWKEAMGKDPPGNGRGKAEGFKT